MIALTLQKCAISLLTCSYRAAINKFIMLKKQYYNCDNT